ncbi:MAG: hypothetical protein K2O80_04490 [Helicobacter apodemus]|uniref:hypothetical protein n=1 Tax=Helicobacter apodemus TaxID=135569 RepID=UPI0018842806|nr:hypothetical protein [Helicobacter apodemus]MDE6958789.1 hypothetical protein [Helicobacter apodemus]
MDRINIIVTLTTAKNTRSVTSLGNSKDIGRFSDEGTITNFSNARKINSLTNSSIRKPY